MQEDSIGSDVKVTQCHESAMNHLPLMPEIIY